MIWTVPGLGLKSPRFKSRAIMPPSALSTRSAIRPSFSPSKSGITAPSVFCFSILPAATLIFICFHQKFPVFNLQFSVFPYYDRFQAFQHEFASYQLRLLFGGIRADPYTEKLPDVRLEPDDGNHLEFLRQPVLEYPRIFSFSKDGCQDRILPRVLNRLQGLDLHPGCSPGNESQLLGGAVRKLEDPVPCERPAIIYPHLDALVIMEIGNTNGSAERQYPVSRRDTVHVECFPARGLPAVKFVAGPRCHTRFSIYFPVSLDRCRSQRRGGVNRGGWRYFSYRARHEEC